ncbi:cytochrome-c peroxidase [Methylosinus sp. Sm6]|uniref:cytochrome-c peroxidase n=1 Tax=Methylosinus sp. Sm6 TaxID=2866948 RepID=UPI0021051DD2|nr:cytochrome c peroxidase [Methylosinus sp. Sm6]
MAAGAAPAADEAGLSPLELLGKKIFEDTRLSEPPGVSCASCHEASKAFQGNNGSPVAALAQGSRAGVLGKRNTPTLSYISYAPRFGLVEEQEEEATEGALVPAGGMFWDGRADDLVAQVEGPLLEPREMNNPSKAAVVEKIKAGDYAGLAKQVYGESLFSDPDVFVKLARAVAAFESTPRFHPFASKFDDFLRGKEKLSKEEARGFALFMDKKKGNCLACHAGKKGSRNPQDWLFTDFTYDGLGAPRNPAVPDNKDPAWFDPGLCVRKDFPLAPPSYVEGLCGQFKTPTLRNVAITGPYLHNGVFSSLRDVVAFYATRDTNPERWFPKVGGKTAKFDDLAPPHHENVNVKEVPYDRRPGQKPRLDDKEIDSIVAFLLTLTDRPPGAARR